MKPKILIADDDRFFQKRIIGCFDPDTYDITAVSNGRDALQHLLSHSYDLAVVDFHLPVMTAGEILAQAFSNEVETPVIVVTGDDTLETERIARSNHCAYFFIKPFDGDDLASVAQTILEHRSSGRPIIKTADVRFLHKG